MCFIVLVDKPSNLTSRQVCDIVKNKLHANKVGHSGTLDINATGLLLIAIDEATKIMPLFERMDKVYEGIMHLHKDVDDERLEKCIKNFVGRIIQKPPVKSRVKRVERERNVYFFDIIERFGRDVKFLTKVEAGTYIRKLVHDIGMEIGGAHLKFLRRLQIGYFSINEAVKIENLSKTHLIRIEDALVNCKKIFIREEFKNKVLNGCFIRYDWVEKTEGELNKNDKVAIFVGEKILGIGIVLLNKKFFVKPDRLLNCMYLSSQTSQDL
ncbi:MAG: hypothetical protein N3E38_01680 [Candidatus Aenigmarchaeota archaeon]|nr:hypothetical protein [Candidatus Aenigmarchaeota archaeon]MCX8179431.1 hypothetical protein [Candidatus Aenigmarchaeota archaeon]